MANETFYRKHIVEIWVSFIIVLALVIALFAYPAWRVWQQGMSGKAKLRESEWSKKILIEEANAASEAEVTRAKGVAEANRIIGESLRGNEEYLRYLWIQSLSDGHTETIYVPTEANLPILEATRRFPTK